MLVGVEDVRDRSKGEVGLICSYFDGARISEIKQYVQHDGRVKPCVPLEILG